MVRSTPVSVNHVEAFVEHLFGSVGIWHTPGMHPPVASRPTTMTDYGVPDDPEGLLPWSWAAERLAANKNYWVATVDRRGRPHAMPVWGWWDDASGSFWFSCGNGAAKVAHLAANPAVSVMTDDTVEVVSIRGTATKVPTDPVADDLAAAAAAWGARYENDDATADQFAAFFTSSTVFRVEAETAFSIIERADEFGPRATRWDW